MKQMMTAKLKLHHTPDQLQALRQAQLAYRDALNFVSRHAFAHGKMSNQIRLQEDTYQDIRSRFRLPAQMACNVPRQVGATYKALWTKVKSNVGARASGHTKKRYKGLDSAPRYLSPTLTYNYGRDYSLKTEQRVSVLTLNGRIVLPYSGYTRHVAVLQGGVQAHVQIGAAKLWYDKPHKQFYLLVSIEVEVADPTAETVQRVVGVDVGQRYLAVATDTQNHTAFFSGAQARGQADHFARLRKRLQHKGTRSATRRLVELAGRERRLKQDRNHTISRRIVDTYPHSLLGLEDLTHMRERTQGKRTQGKQASPKQRKANRHAAAWAFTELQGYLTYKATLAGSRVVKVDAHYTSQACPRCGYAAKDNRPKKGLLFVCQACHFTLHADLVGARNIALRTLLVRQDWTSTGALSTRLDVSDNEAKAAQW